MLLRRTNRAYGILTLVPRLLRASLIPLDVTPVGSAASELMTVNPPWTSVGLEAFLFTPPVKPLLLDRIDCIIGCVHTQTNEPFFRFLMSYRSLFEGLSGAFVLTR